MTDVGIEVLGMLTREEVAALLRMSLRTLDRRIKSGQLRAEKDGSHVLIAPEAVAAYKAGLPSAARQAAA